MAKGLIPKLLSVALLAVCATGFSQTKMLTLIGKVTNALQEPLPFASVGISSKGIFTITNVAGHFALRVPREFVTDSLMISSSGYQSRRLPLQTYSKTSDTILIILEYRVDALAEVIVSPPNALKIIKAAIANIPGNTFDQRGIIKSFYREVVNRDDDPVVLSEAVFELFNYGNGSKTDRQIKLVQKRSIMDQQKTAGLEFGMSAESIRHFDIVKELEKSGVLNLKDLDKYEFRYKDETEHNGQTVIQIAFDQKSTVKESLYKGIIRLEKHSLAFVSFDFAKSEKGLKYARYGSGKMRLLMKLMGISVTVERDDYKINYRKLQDKWLLSSAKTNTKLRFKSERKQFDFTCVINGDFVNTEIDTSRQIPFDEAATIDKSRSIEFRPDEPETLFWKDHNVIMGDYDEKKLIAKILASNIAAELKSRIEKQLSKLPSDKGLRVDSIVSFYHRHGNFNGVALVNTKGRTILNKTYGFARFEPNMPFPENPRFRIGSLSKSFTAVLIQQLNQEGLLRPDDSIGKYLTGFRHGSVTIEQLLTHTSGIWNFTSESNMVTSAIMKRMSPETMLNRFGSDTLDFLPGTKFSYSNAGYTALAAIIEKLRGRPFAEVVQQFIFVPLGMQGSAFGADSLNTIGYLYGKPEPFYAVSNMAGAGGISSTANDLLLWHRALTDTVILGKTFRDNLFKPRSQYKDWGADYGYGWMIDRYLFSASRKEKIIYHPGTDFGYNSLLARQPMAENLLILLNNTGDFQWQDLTELIFNEINK